MSDDMNRYDPHTDKFLKDTQYNILGTDLAEVGTDVPDINVGDMISRQAAIDTLTEYGNGRAVFISVGEAVIRIEQLPPAQPERIKGHWIAMEKKNLFRCSNCCAVIYSESEYDRNEFHKFCGRCGAEMEVTV